MHEDILCEDGVGTVVTVVTGDGAGRENILWEMWAVANFHSRITLHTCLCLKKRHPFYICYNLIGCHPILPILGRNIPQEIWNKHKCTDNHISFHMFVLYRVKSSNDFYGIQ